MLTVVDAFSVFDTEEFTALFRVVVVIGVIRFRRWKVTAVTQWGNLCIGLSFAKLAYSQYE